jgi:hypothetical protein
MLFHLADKHAGKISAEMFTTPMITALLDKLASDVPAQLQLAALLALEKFAATGMHHEWDHDCPHRLIV